MKIREQLLHPADRLWHSTSMLILGKPGSGKTRLGSTVGRTSFNEPCPLLVIDQDNGAGGQRFSNPALIPESFNDYRNLFVAIISAVQSQEKPPYKMKFLGREWSFSGILIDTLNRMQDILRRDIKGGYLSGKRLQIQDYGTMLDDLLGAILTLKELSEVKPFHIVLTAQIAPDKIVLKTPTKTDDLTSAYYWLPSLMGSIAPKLPEHVDMVVTTYRDPASRQWMLYGQDIVTDVGTLAGKLRYLDFFKGKSDNLPQTWWEIVKAHGVDISNPGNIGKLDTLNTIEQHWSDDPENRAKLEAALTKQGIPLQALFDTFNVSDWAEINGQAKTGKEALEKVRAYWAEHATKPISDLEKFCQDVYREIPFFASPEQVKEVMAEIGMNFDPMDRDAQMGELAAIASRQADKAAG